MVSASQEYYPQTESMISWRRRAVTVPTWFVLAIMLSATLPLTLPVAGLYDIVTRRRFNTARTFVFFTHFFVVECCGLVGAFFLWIWHGLFVRDAAKYEHANRRMQRWWARSLFWGPVRIYGMKVDIEGLECLEDPSPAVVMSRHASTIDTMLPIAVVRHLKNFRYVIKAELLVDPALDYVAQRFPNVFVRRGGADPEREVQRVVELGRNLDSNDAVVIYPEGTRFTEQKRQRLLTRKGGDDPVGRIAKKLRYTLPPLREGAVSLVESTRNADLVFIAHRGVDQAGSMADLLAGGLLHAKLEVKIWRFSADEVPRDRKAIEAFLVEQWERIDRFVGGEDATRA